MIPHIPVTLLRSPASRCTRWSRRFLAKASR